MEPKIKISKQLANFMQPKSNKDKNTNPSKNKTEKEKNNQIDKNNDKQVKQKAQKPVKKKSRNPFQSVHDWIKFSQQIDAKINSSRQGLEMERLSKLSFLKKNAQTIKQQQEDDNKIEEIRYQDCLTLQVLKKNHNYCLKKILHVPTLCIYYLRESTIDFHFDNHQIVQWIQRCNDLAEIPNSNFKKILKLYWNVPESHYSLLYQYVEGAMLETIIDNISTLPVSFIKKTIIQCLSNDYQIFNSQWIITKGQQGNKVSFLPVYQQVDDLIHHERDFRHLMKIDNAVSQQFADRKMSTKIGFFLLISYFGDVLIDEDISCIFFQNQTQCCLMHRLIDNKSSLISLFIDQNMSQKAQQKQKQLLIDFLCKCLKFKPENRSQPKELIKHRFLRMSDDTQYCSMQEIIRCLQYSGNSRKGYRNNISKQLAQHKMNRILQSISGVLQGSKIIKNDFDFSKNNKNIRSLVREFGMIGNQKQMEHACEQLCKKLMKVYGI